METSSFPEKKEYKFIYLLYIYKNRENLLFLFILLAF